jgi:hypothetical protein
MLRRANMQKESEPFRFSRDELDRVLDELVAEGELNRFVNDHGQVSYVAAKFVN